MRSQRTRKHRRRDVRPRPPSTGWCTLCGADGDTVRHTRSTCPQRPALPARDAARAMLDASKVRLAAQGFDADAIVERAIANLQYWRDHPAEWDAESVVGVVIDDEGVP